jgi:hypothetical protein
LSDAEGETTATQVWIEFAVKCNYLEPKTREELCATYDAILGKLVTMILHPEKWVIG